MELPQTEVVLPNFDRSQLSAQLRMAYDVWERLTAVTGPNGNQDDLANINLVGALNILRNGGAEKENGEFNQVPAGWEEDRPGGFVSRQTRTNAQAHSGAYSLPLSVPDTLDEGQSHDWVQRRPGGHPGGRYLMQGHAHSDLSTQFQLRGVLREFSGGLSEQTVQTTLAPDTWTQASGRLDLPGDAQVTRTMPALHQFRAAIERPLSGTATAHVDDLQVLSLSQLSHYEGEYPSGSTGPDGARVRVLRDRFGRPRRILDPLQRQVTFAYDHLDRVVRVEDSQGLSLAYEWDFLGNLHKFIDSRGQVTEFVYDALNRTTQIIQPDPDQVELFSYTPGGDLASYTNCRSQRREFFYDAAHRLVRIDYLGTTTESVTMTYDAVGNLLTLEERNGDRLSMTYDVLNRLQSTARSSLNGPRWALANQYDSRGNRIALRTPSAYGRGRYGQDRYATGTAIFTAQYNAKNQMVSLSDSLSNQTTFAFDVDGRLAEVNHPTPNLQTRHRYDLVGKLLESQLTHNSNQLWDLRYDYNLAGERLRQVSRWDDSGNTFEYQQDASGRLIQETINRFVVNSLEGWSRGTMQGTRVDLDGNLQLLSRSDDFQAPYLDLQRWELVVREPVATAVGVRQDQGLHLLTSSGDTRRNGRHSPAGVPYTAANAATDYPHIAVQASDNVGHFDGRILLRHRLPLEGAFDIQISLQDFNLFEGSLGLGVSGDPFEAGPGGSRFFPFPGGFVDVNGADIVVQNHSQVNDVAFNNQALPATPTRLRLQRTANGPDWLLQAYYHDGTDWVTDPNWVNSIGGQTLYAFLHLTGQVGTLVARDFVDAAGAAYAVGTQASFESSPYDAGFSCDWTRLSWTATTPANTDVRFQVATSESPDGPWSYGSDLLTPGPLTGLTGRYARFRALLSSADGSSTPMVSEVSLTHSGVSGSRLSRWEYDPAGNILSQTVITDAGSEVETRVYNDLNQLISSSGGWTYQYDLDGNMTVKTNGTAEGNERWELTWDTQARLTQVSKGVYDATPTLVNEFTVAYQYDEMGRMLRRDDGTQQTTYQWDGFDCIRETTGESVTEYLVPGLAVHSFIRDGEYHSIQGDALGHVRTIVDANGVAVSRSEFGAFGTLLDGSFALPGQPMQLGYTGRLGVRTDTLTNLVWMRNRWYEASHGRFISRDPVGISAGQNLYAYVGNSPEQLNDPSGLQPPGSSIPWAYIKAGRAPNCETIYDYKAPPWSKADSFFAGFAGTIVVGAVLLRAPLVLRVGVGIYGLAGIPQAANTLVNDVGSNQWFGLLGGLAGGAFLPRLLPRPIGGPAIGPPRQSAVVDTGILENQIIYGMNNLKGRIPVVPAMAIVEFMRVPGRPLSLVVEFMRSNGGRMARPGNPCALEAEAAAHRPKLVHDAGDLKVGSAAVRENLPLMTTDRPFHRRMIKTGHESELYHPAKYYLGSDGGRVIDPVVGQ